MCESHLYPILGTYVQKQMVAYYDYKRQACLDETYRFFRKLLNNASLNRKFIISKVKDVL